MTIGHHIELEGDTTTTQPVIVPDYILEYSDSEWPNSDIGFWHWMMNHFDE
jgi:hypothetical protein